MCNNEQFYLKPANLLRMRNFYRMLLSIKVLLTSNNQNALTNDTYKSNNEQKLMHCRRVIYTTNASTIGYWKAYGNMA